MSLREKAERLLIAVADHVGRGGTAAQVPLIEREFIVIREAAVVAERERIARLAETTARTLQGRADETHSPTLRDMREYAASTLEAFAEELRRGGQ